MVVYVLDASAILRFTDGEAGVIEVTELFLLRARGECRLVASAVNWGEVAGKLMERFGREKAEGTLSELLRQGLEGVEASASRSVAAAFLKASHKLPYADAFGVELATDSPDHVLVTADFDVLPTQGLIRIEFLPTKPRQ